LFRFHREGKYIEPETHPMVDVLIDEEAELDEKESSRVPLRMKPQKHETINVIRHSAQAFFYQGGASTKALLGPGLPPHFNALMVKMQNPLSCD
jgi:hypothetical protein